MVEDHADTARALVRLLNSLGHRAESVADAIGAIDWMSGRNANLIITDMMMPGEMDGLGLVRFIRHEPRLRNVPVVLFTAISDNNFSDYALSVGATAVWFKSQFDYSSLPSRVDAILQGSQTASHQTAAAPAEK